MIGPLIPVIIFLAGQLGVAIWWASRVSTQLDNLSVDVREMKSEVTSLRSEVQNHDTAIAVMRAVSRAQAQNGVSK